MHPILFAIDRFYIGTYGLMVAIGLLAATSVALWRAKRVGVEGDRLLDFILLAVVGGLVGGRVTYVALDLTMGERYFLSHPLEIVFSRTGFVFLGGVVAGVALGAWYLHRVRLNKWLVADILFGVLPLGHAFGRIGCFMAGCCYGRVADPNGPLGFLAVCFPRGTRMGEAYYPGIAFGDQIAEGLVKSSDLCSLPVWPVQLFESAGNLAIFFALVWFWRRKRFDGQIFLLYILFYGALRFLLEFLRGDVQRGALGPLSTSQAISLIGFVAVAVLWPYLQRRLPGPATVEPAVTDRQAKAHGKKSPRSRDKR
ncbi:prolipoprotein diacylglyceryl transferase [Candidatus Sumerlaeota bacterium]|nr:prolipoprotein diacylglyceryl transferase [Candidatus Sumerlaeota bacterium]